MKKVILLLSIFFLGILTCQAISFTEGSYISGSYVKKEKGTLTKYLQIRFVHDNEGKLIYCLEPFKSLDTTGVNYTTINDNLVVSSGLTESQWHRVMLLAYYGYGYTGHEEAKWYSVTQVMIWRTVEPTANIYFTSSLNGTYVTKYEAEMAEMESLINSHQIKPSFNNQHLTINLGEQINLADNNQVMNRYNLLANNQINAIKQGNNLIISGNQPITSTNLYYQKVDQYYPVGVVVHLSGDKQDVIGVGSYTPELESINISVTASQIKLNISVNKNVYSNEAKFTATYGLYDVNNNLKETITVNQSSQYLSTYLPYGTYYVRQLNIGQGYVKDNNNYQIIINSSEVKIVNLINNLITNEINIIKCFGNDLNNEYEPEVGAVFEIYDNQNNLVSTLETDINGQQKLNLGFGKYLIKQIKGKAKHALAEDREISVEAMGQKQEVKLYNNLFSSRVVVYLKDEQGELITENLKVSIDKEYELEAGSCLTDRLLDGEYEVNPMGQLTEYKLNPIPLLKINETAEYEIINGLPYIIYIMTAKPVIKELPVIEIIPPNPEPIEPIIEEKIIDDYIPPISPNEINNILIDNNLILENKPLVEEETILAVNPFTKADINIFVYIIVASLSLISYFWLSKRS